VVFRQSLDQPFLGSFQLLDDRERLRAILRRDGAGFRVLMMDYVLEDADRRPIYLIRHPPPRPGIHLGGAFSLLRPDGSKDGELTLKAGLRSSTCSLERTGTEALVVTRPAIKAKLEMRQGLRLVATGRIDRFAFPGGIHLVFPAPPAPEVPRGPLVALMAFASTHWQLPQSPLGPAP
jgi:hypothetical protein